MLSICYRGIPGLGCVIPMESVATVTGVFVVSVVRYLWNQWLLLQGYSWSRLLDTYGISGYCYRDVRGLGCVIPMESVATVTGVFVVSVVTVATDSIGITQPRPRIPL
jgi:hypothetical protein